MQVTDITSSAYSPPASKASTGSRSDFSDLFMRSLEEANRMQSGVESMVERAAIGESINPATMAAAINKADLAFRTLVQMRNKLIQAFDELRQMQV